MIGCDLYSDENLVAYLLLLITAKSFANVSKINSQYSFIIDLINKENVMNQNIKLLTLAIISAMGITACSGSSDDSTPVSVGGE